MKKFYFLFLMIMLLSKGIIAQSDCSSAVIVCGNTQTYNPSGIGLKLEQLACGGIEHNSIWVAFQAKASGKLNFVIRPFTLAGLPILTDLDWSLYALPGAPGTSNCDNKTQMSCNFSGSSTVFGIPGATGMATPNYTAAQFNPGVDVIVGNWYAIIVDQYSNTTPLLFSIQFTGNPESPYLNSSPGIFNNTPDFNVTTLPGCNGNFSFSSTSAATAGIASYSWNFGDGSTSSTMNPTHTYVTPGTYYVNLTVTDNNGCQTEIRKKVVYNNTPPVVTAAGIYVTPSCSDANNGTITVTTTGVTTPGVSGGTPPYTYALVSPSPTPVPQQSSNLFSGLQAGGYTVKVTDACGKSATGIVTVGQVATNSLIGLGIQNIQSACTGSATGTATIFANGTTPPYTMSLVNSSPVLTSPITAIQRDPISSVYYVTFTNLLPGIYTVEATDGCGKLRRATFTVTASTAPTATTVPSPSCTGSATGTLSVTATAATGLSGSGSPGAFQYALISPSPIIRPFQSSSVFENLLPGTYTIAVKDACGNIGTATSTVASAVAPNFGTSFTTPSCPNSSSGSIEVQNGSNAGGGSPYTYELVPPSQVTRPAQTDNRFSNLPPGTYTIRMQDVCATKVVTTVTVAAGAAPSFTVSPGASCVTPGSGTLTINPGANSISPFTFELISPGATIRPSQGSNIANSNSSIFTGLDQGSYTIHMSDGCGVDVTGTASIGGPASLLFPAGSTSVPSCASGSTGSITVAQPTTGLGAYRYELITPSPVTAGPQYSRIFSQLPPGDYTIRITDSCGSQVTSATPVTVGAASAPSLTVSTTSSCITASGTITCLAATGNQGGGPYLFSLIAPSVVTRPDQVSPIFTGLPTGNYTVRITDHCGATGSVTATVAPAGPFIPEAGGSVVSCNGGSYNSQIIVTTPQNFTPGGPIPGESGGGPYTYAIFDASNTTLIAGPQSGNIFSLITPLAGTPTHTVRVTDACGNTGTNTVSINPPSPLTSATISATTASCAYSATGVIRVSAPATGGLPPYSYSLVDAVTTAVAAGPQSGTTFTGVPANATGYKVKVTDACGSTTTSISTLLFPAAVNPTATVSVTASCGSSSTGKIVVTPGTGATLAGGTFSYYLYDVSNTVLLAGPQSMPVFSDLAAGSYTVRIHDRCGSEGTVAATVTSTPAALTSSGTPGGTCSGGNTGVITGSFTGGSLPVSYSLLDQATENVLAGPQADNIFSGLAAGNYLVRVTDACGTAVNSPTITVGVLSTAPTLTTSVHLDCSGIAYISGFGGGGSGGPYTYAICPGSGCTSFGSYSTNSTFSVLTNGTYRISVKDKCGLETISGDIVIVIPPQAVITGIIKTNPCGPTTITVNYTNVPNTPYYSVDGSNFGPVIGTLGVGSHTLRVADYNAGTFGCTSDEFTFSIGNISPTITGNLLLCPGSTTVLDAGSWAGYAWSTGATTQTLTVSSAGDYSVTVTNGGGCTGSTTATVTFDTPPTPSITGNTVICPGGSTDLDAGVFSGYIWSTGATTQSITGVGAGTYGVTVTGANGCTGSTSAEVTTRPEFTAGAIELSGETICPSGTPGVIGSVSAASGGDGTITYSWRSSADGFTTAIAGADQASYTPPAGLTTTTSYRRYAHDGSCNPAFTASLGTWTVTVRDEFSAGSILTTGETICQGGDPSEIQGQDLPSGGDGNYSYQWQLSTSGPSSGYSDIAGATSVSYDPPAGLANETWYRRLAADGSCHPALLASSGVWKVSFLPAFTAGTAGSDETICTGSVPGQVTASAPSGGMAPYSLQWQSSVNNADFYNIPSATNAIYQPGALTATTYYRQVQTSSGGCGEVQTNTVTITVTPSTSGGEVTGGGQVCTGTNSTLLTLVNFSGSVLRWEYSTNGTDWVVIPASAASTYTATNLTVNTQFRAVVSSGSCPEANSLPATITVFSSFRISGQARYENNPKTPLDGLKITLKQGTATIGTPVVTGSTGYYEFNNLPNGTYSLEIASAHPSGQWQTWNGVNNTDYLLVSRHAAGIQLLPATPPVVRVAASAKLPHPAIDAADANAIRLAARYGWGSPVPYFDTVKWVFSGIDASSALTGINLQCANVTRDIRGLCTGDVNGSYLPPSGVKTAIPGLQLAARGSLPLTREITFPIRAEQDMELGAITLMLDFDPSLVTISGVTMPRNGGEEPFHSITENTEHPGRDVLSIGWISLSPVRVTGGETIILVHALVKDPEAAGLEPGTLVRFTLHESPMNELADGSGEVISDARLSMPDAGGTNGSPERNTGVVSVYPNPVRDVLNIEYLTDEDGTFSAELVSIQGSVVASITGSEGKGALRRVTMDVNGVANGVYMLRTRVGDNVTTTKVIVNR